MRKFDSSCFRQANIAIETAIAASRANNRGRLKFWNIPEESLRDARTAIALDKSLGKVKMTVFILLSGLSLFLLAVAVSR
jgi:hypothetical protein